MKTLYLKRQQTFNEITGTPLPEYFEENGVQMYVDHVDQSVLAQFSVSHPAVYERQGYPANPIQQACGIFPDMDTVWQLSLQQTKRTLYDIILFGGMVIRTDEFKELFSDDLDGDRFDKVFTRFIRRVNGFSGYYSIPQLKPKEILTRLKNTVVPNVRDNVKQCSFVILYLKYYESKAGLMEVFVPSILFVDQKANIADGSVKFD